MEIALSTAAYTLPIQTVSLTEKESESWIKQNLDFFDWQAMSVTTEKQEDMKKLRYLNGEADPTLYRFISDPLFLGVEKKDKYGETAEVTHFPILTRPINTIVGEAVKRPLNFYCKSESARARNQYFNTKKEMLTSFVRSSIMERIKEMAKKEGVDLNTDQGQQYFDLKTPENIQNYMDEDYVDIGERLSNRILKNVWKRENLELEFIDGFKHGVSLGKEFYHIYVKDNKATVRNISQDDVFFQKSLTSRWVSESQYAGIISFLTPASIIDLYWNDLNSDDIEYLQNLNRGHISSGGNFNYKANDIVYNTDIYANWAGHPHALYMAEIKDAISDFQLYGKNSIRYELRGLIRTINVYWKSYRKVGFLKNADGTTDIVDDNYEVVEELGESIEYKTINQIYTGLKIADRVYKAKPYQYQEVDIENLSFSPLPIEGCYYNNNYTKPIGLLDLMIPWNEMYDIAAHELKKDMSSALGKVLFMSTDHIPDIPGFTMEKWLYWVKELKIAWAGADKSKKSNFAHYQSADMSFAEQMLAKMNIMERIKQECNSIAGFSEPRLGNSSAENTLGQSSQSLIASVNQTEYWFFKHAHLANKVVQQVIDLERMLLRDKKNSLRYLYDDYELQFIDDTALSAFKNEKIGVYLTNTGDDLVKQETVKGILQQAAAKGENYDDLLELAMASSVSEIRSLYKQLRRSREKSEEIQRKHEESLNNANLESQEKDRQLKDKMNLDKIEGDKERAYIQSFAFGKNDMSDNDNSGVPDILEYEKLSMKSQEINHKQQIDNRNLDLKEKQMLLDYNSKLESNKVKLQISKDNLKNKVPGEK